MPITATVYKILIASPCDVKRERELCRDVILDWNAANSDSTRVFLEPVLWETHVACTLGNDPQAIINQQLLSRCDFVIAVFWSRIGLPTKNAEGGSVEELNYFLEKKARTIVGFSQAPLPPQNIDIDQIAQLKVFREKCEKNGIVFTYHSTEEFKSTLASQLAKSMNRILVERDLDQFSKKENVGSESTYNIQEDYDRILIQAHQNKAFDQECLKIALDRFPEKQKLRILDAGCGNAIITYALFAEMDNVEVIGVDRSEEAIRYASHHLKSKHINFHCADIHSYIQGSIDRGELFDVIFSAQLMHHIDAPEVLMKHFWRCLNKAGALLIRNSDDGLDINYPSSKSLDYLIESTHKIQGSSDRHYGRKIYTQMKRLLPDPAAIQIKYDHPSTVSKTAKERVDYFNRMHQFRINYAKQLAQKPNAKPSDVALYEKLITILANERERFRSQDDIFALEVQITGIALKAK